MTLQSHHLVLLKIMLLYHLALLLPLLLNPLIVLALLVWPMIGMVSPRHSRVCTLISFIGVGTCVPQRHAANTQAVKETLVS